MLILTRKTGERIYIGDDIIITNLGYYGHGQIKIGIDAPENINIAREELLSNNEENNDTSKIIEM